MLKAISILTCLLLGTLTSQAAETSMAKKLSSQIRKCLVLSDEVSKHAPPIKIEFTLDAKGVVESAPVLLVAPEGPATKAYVEAAKRAIIRCAPYPFAADATVRVNFVP